MKKQCTPLQALPKIKHYCSYAERSHKDVKDKLYGMGLAAVDVNKLIATLIDEDYLNEERYATQFAGGHFRQKKWGKVKIVYALKQKGVSEANIRKALKELNSEDYRLLLYKLAKTKWLLLKGEHYITRQAKTKAYLAQKGYESELVTEVLKTLIADIRD